jgi:transcriptional regulator GlxA family with amidase domain
MRNIAVLIPDSVRLFELSIFCEIFGIDRSADGFPCFDFEVVTERPGVPVATAGGLVMTPTAGLERLSQADLVAVMPAENPPTSISAELQKALQNAVNRGARVVAVCSASFTLAAAGVLDGRSATAHWMDTEELAARYPRVDVHRDVLYVDDDPIFTSAGTAAAIDLCLHLLRKDHGSSVAAAMARRMAAAPHRAGDQLQRAQVATPQAGHDDGINSLLHWALDNLDEDLSIDALARRTYMSPRSFIRRFGSVTGTSPYAWVVEQRIRLAQRILEEDPQARVSDIAAKAGFRSPSVLRDHFRRKFGCSPSSYRTIFNATNRPAALPDTTRTLQPVGYC